MTAGLLSCLASIPPYLMVESIRASASPSPSYFMTKTRRSTLAKESSSDAIRVSMRAGSVLIWNQTLAHGTQPNVSRSNRMAQFLKAFSRRHVFSEESKEIVAPPQEGKAVLETEFRENRSEDADEGDKKGATDKQKQKQKQGKAKEIEAPKPLVWDGPARLRRRSVSLREQLRQSAALEIVSPLGLSLFGLDTGEHPS